ncbi:hypothetical protein SAZ11_62385 [Streptomyces sp. FXJ1.4098]|uniref:hypothetical protein n=1 Tax=Streptomyces sp. NPDC020845 TaxID=3365096 RepID=UPI0029930F4C|nr:hypothetical protein [Streptomyces sp. FXJ1.4098]
MRLASGRHFEAGVNLSTWAIARRLPRTLIGAARLGWRTDRPAVLALIGCQIGAAALTATALAATSHVLAAVFTGGDIAADLRESLTSVVVLALAPVATSSMPAPAPPRPSSRRRRSVRPALRSSPRPRPPSWWRMRTRTSRMPTPPHPTAGTRPVASSSARARVGGRRRPGRLR